MDLRVIKTKKNIREAFFRLRQKYSVDEIKISILCQEALINKTTFYNHYQDIYALAEELENEAVEKFFEKFQDIDKLLSAPDRFITGMNLAVESENNRLRILFRGKFDELTKRIEKHIQNQYAGEEQMLVDFLIGGSMHLILKSKHDNKKVEEFLVEIIQKTLK